MSNAQRVYVSRKEARNDGINTTQIIEMRVGKIYVTMLLDSRKNLKL